MNLATKTWDGKWATKYRPGTTDVDVLTEVIDHHVYRRLRDGFVVKPGERWLDLGANIGAFALYCRMHGATVECWEPEPECFKILQLNAPGAELHNSAITTSHEPRLDFYTSKNPDNHYRTTIIPVSTYKPAGSFDNIYGSYLLGRKYDGVKLDVEGSEFGLIDEWLLPETNKLVMEYHHSRDKSAENMARRFKKLREHFKTVKYPKALDTYIESGGTAPLPRFDSIVFCWN